MYKIPKQRKRLFNNQINTNESNTENTKMDVYVDYNCDGE